MILRPPLVNCPVCKYSLQGLPVAHRCPECGFEYDEQTVVFKPKTPWKTCASLLGSQFFAFYFFGFNAMAMAYRMAGPIASMGILMFFAALPIGTVWWVFRAHRKGRFAAIRRDAIWVRNFEGMVTLPWPDCSMVALSDIQPWIKRRGVDQEISLRGLFDSEVERKVFERVVAAARSGGDPVAASLIATPLSKKAEDTFVMRPSDRRTLIRVGVSILVMTFVLLFVGVFVIPPPKWLLGVAGALGWTGGIITLVGFWRSDRK